MDALSLATDGIICIPGNPRYIMPFNLQLKSDAIKLNLKYLETIKLNIFLDQKKSSLKLDNLKLSQKFTNNLKINLKKCEE